MTLEEINKSDDIITLNKLIDRARILANRNRKFSARIEELTISVVESEHHPDYVQLLCKKDDTYYKLPDNQPRPTNAKELYNFAFEINAMFASRGLDYPFRTAKEHIELDLI